MAVWFVVLFACCAQPRCEVKEQFHVCLSQDISTFHPPYSGVTRVQLFRGGGGHEGVHHFFCGGHVNT